MVESTCTYYIHVVVGLLVNCYSNKQTFTSTEEHLHFNSKATIKSSSPILHNLPLAFGAATQLYLLNAANSC